MSIEVYKPIEKIETNQENLFKDFDGNADKYFYDFLSKNQNSSEERSENFKKFMDSLLKKLEKKKELEINDALSGFRGKMKGLIDVGKNMIGGVININKKENGIETEKTPTISEEYGDFKDIFNNMDVENKKLVSELITNHKIIPKEEDFEKNPEGAELTEQSKIFFKDYLYSKVQTWNSSGETSSTEARKSTENQDEEKIQTLEKGQEMILETIDPNKQYFSTGNVKIVGSRLIYMGSDNPGKEEITVIVIDQNKKEIRKKIFVIDIVEESIDNTPEAISNSGINPGDLGGESNG